MIDGEVLLSDLDFLLHENFKSNGSQASLFVIEDKLKKRYILALFLMNDEAQQDYLGLWTAFAGRCNTIERGEFTLKSDEAGRVLRTVDEVKKELILKIQSSN